MHFLRFEVSDDIAEELKTGADWDIGVQHPVYTFQVSVEGETRDSLRNDLD